MLAAAEPFEDVAIRDPKAVRSGMTVLFSDGGGRRWAVGPYPEK